MCSFRSLDPLPWERVSTALNAHNALDPFNQLLVGIDAALRGHATLLLDDGFWDGLRGRGESARGRGEGGGRGDAGGV